MAPKQPSPPRPERGSGGSSAADGAARPAHGADRGGRRPGGAASRGATSGGSGRRGGRFTPRRLRPALTSRAAILALVMCAIALSLAYPLREYIAQRSEIAQLRDERSTLHQDVAELEERREELADPDYVEREARTRLHYQYPDEHAYIVIDGESEGIDPAAEDRVGAAEPWFTRLWRSVQEADQATSTDDDPPPAEAPPRD